MRLEAAESCVELGSIVEEVEGVIGRPLASVTGVTFDVEITRAGSGAWRMRLHTDESAASPGETAPRPRATRELEGASCAEVASAAAVAIAVSIQATVDEPPAVPSAPPPALESPRARPPVPEPERAYPAVSKAGPAVPKLHPRVLAALMAVGDAGSLPHVGVGGELDVAIELGRARAVAFGSAFAPQDTSSGVAAGGEFTLMFGGILGCAAPRFSRATLTACLGGELGRLAGEGTGATHPRLGSALWAAGRGELGLAVPVGTGWSFVVRGAVTVPVVRPVFEVNGTLPVHQPSAVGGRAEAGVELAF